MSAIQAFIIAVKFVMIRLDPIHVVVMLDMDLILMANLATVSMQVCLFTRCKTWPLQ